MPPNTIVEVATVEKSEKVANPNLERKVIHHEVMTNVFKAVIRTFVDVRYC